MTTWDDGLEKRSIRKEDFWRAFIPCAIPGCLELVEGGTYYLNHELDKGLDEE
jgi:hypothetical protein